MSPGNESVGNKRFADFDLSGKVFIVTGGARGLGLALAEALVEAGGCGEYLLCFSLDGKLTCTVYCFDVLENPDHEWDEAQSRVVPEWGGSLTYIQQDVRDTEHLQKTISDIADKHKQLNGVIAAAAIIQNAPAMDSHPKEVTNMMAINYTGVFMTAQAAAAAMMKYKCRGSICLIASMSGVVANKGMLTPIYNSTKAALIQLARNLAMEWSPIQEDGTGGIRVNCISPGHIKTPMVEQLCEEDPSLEKTWTRENMLGRLAHTDEFKGAALFLLSNASSYMTANNLVIDGGHTAW